jgi:EpsD family peptidyl-prolyl cis-trans isomerase
MQTKLSIIFLIAAFLAGCASKAQEGKTIAEVNGQKLTYEYLMDQIPEEFRDSLTQQDIAKAIDNWVNMELLYQEAVKHNIDKDIHVLNSIEQAKKSIIARKYLELGMGQNTMPTEREIDSVYQAEKDKFTNKEAGYHLGHIVLKNQKAADAVYVRLQKGDDFAQMAKDYSEDTSSAKAGGDIGFVPESALEKEMIAALNATAINGFTRPLESQGGYFHIFQLKEKINSGTTAALSEVRDDIIQVLTSTKQQAAFDSIVTSLKAKAQIRKYPIGNDSKKQ